MPLNQLALLELTEAMRTADDGKLMRTLLRVVLGVTMAIVGMVLTVLVAWLAGFSVQSSSN